MIISSCLLSLGYAQNIPIRYRKTVAFITRTDVLGDYTTLGTGFFMILPDSNSVFFYLITAKHVILDKATKQVFEEISISYNRRERGRDSISLFLFEKGPHRNVYYHEDKSVDVAVIALPVAIMSNNSDIEFSVESELFKSKTDFDTCYIKPGTNLFYTGMFSPYIGYEQNYPITRFGKVALISNEKIQFEKSEPRAALFLAETTTFGGNSGSPVFAYGSTYKITSHDNSDRINSKEQNHVPIYMAGIMKGYFQEDSPVQFVNTSDMTPTYSSNIGIAAIIPSYLLYEILKGPGLTAMRKRVTKTQ